MIQFYCAYSSNVTMQPDANGQAVPEGAVAPMEVNDKQYLVHHSSGKYTFMSQGQPLAVEFSNPDLMKDGEGMKGIEAALGIAESVGSTRKNIEQAVRDANDQLGQAPGVNVVALDTVAAYHDMLLSAEGESGEFTLNVDGKSYSCFKLGDEKHGACVITLPNGYGISVKLNEMPATVTSNQLANIVRTAVGAYDDHKVLDVDECDRALENEHHFGEAVRAFNKEGG